MKKLTEKQLERLQKTAPKFLYSFDINPAHDAAMVKHGFDTDQADWDAMTDGEFGSGERTHYGKIYDNAFAKVKAEGVPFFINEIHKPLRVDVRAGDGDQEVIISNDWSRNDAIFNEDGMIDEKNDKMLNEWLLKNKCEYEPESYHCLRISKI